VTNKFVHNIAKNRNRGLLYGLAHADQIFRFLQKPRQSRQGLRDQTVLAETYCEVLMRER